MDDLIYLLGAISVTCIILVVGGCIADKIGGKKHD